MSLLTNLLSKTTLRHLPSHQQVRFVRKTFRFRYAYGEVPKMTEDDYRQTMEDGQVEDLKFERIRFATVHDTPSVLYDEDYARFTRYVMKGGQRALAEDLMLNTFYKIKSFQYMRKRKLENRKENDGDNKKLNQGEESDEVELNPMVIFKRALKNCEPIVITKKVRRGGATYQVPFPLSQSQSEYFAVKWLIAAVLDRPKPRKKNFEEVMAQELIDAAENRGKVVKRKDDIHRLADANKAYAHYRWG